MIKHKKFLVENSYRQWLLSYFRLISIRIYHSCRKISNKLIICARWSLNTHPDLYKVRGQFPKFDFSRSEICRFSSLGALTLFLSNTYLDCMYAYTRLAAGIAQLSIAPGSGTLFGGVILGIYGM